MTPTRAYARFRCATLATSIALVFALPATAQEAYSRPHFVGTATHGTHLAFSQAELDQLLAPVALYPDPLLAQVLMAATYPLEVVQAARFIERNPSLAGDGLARAIAPMGWEPSVAALTQFPSILAMMSDELDWTQRLGEAFIAQRDHLMDTVQMLRDRAYAVGTLQSTEHQHVIVQDRIIQIESWQPHTYWVPYYNPLIVYGSWWHPGYQPFVWVPPAIHRPRHFGLIYSSGFTWGPPTVVSPVLWHDARPVWRGRYVYANDVRFTNVIVSGAHDRGPILWRHDPRHRRHLEYRTPAVRDQYWQGAQGRQAWRDREAPVFVDRHPQSYGDRSAGRGDRGDRGGRPAAEWSRPDAGERVRPVTRPAVITEMRERPMPRLQQPDPAAAPNQFRQRPDVAGGQRIDPGAPRAGTPAARAPAAGAPATRPPAEGEQRRDQAARNAAAAARGGPPADFGASRWGTPAQQQP